MITNQEHLRIAQKVNTEIVNNHPRAILPEQFNKKVKQGAESIAKLEVRGYTLEEIENVFMWALSHSFWSEVFKSIPAVLVTKKNGEIKFQNMLNQYTALNEQTGHDRRVNSIKVYAKERYGYTNNDVADLEEDLHWFYLELCEINEQLSRDNRLEWMDTCRFVDVGKWLVDIERRIVDNDHINNFKDLMFYYFSYLKKGLQKNKPNKLFPSLFSEKSNHFTYFLNNLEDGFEQEVLREEE